MQRYLLVLIPESPCRNVDTLGIAAVVGSGSAVIGKNTLTIPLDEALISATNIGATGADAVAIYANVGRVRFRERP